MNAPFVDRIEGKRAVIVYPDGTEKLIDRSLLPSAAREGDCLTADLKAIDAAATKAAREEIEARRKKLQPHQDDGDDFSL